MSKFREYLLRERTKRTTNKLLNYAEKYQYVLATGDASDIAVLSTKNRNHAMCAIANLSKFQGCYNRWREIKEAYDLKWTTSTDLDIFNSIMESKNQYSAMFQWLKDTCRTLPDKYANAVLFDTLTGLRVGELFQSLHLIQSDFETYVNRERMLLEHYRYRDLFIRRTKKAYISVLTPQILKLGTRCSAVGESGLRNAFKRRDLHDHMKYCRKIHATYLRTKGISAETIDLLQGRAPKSVFARHYLRPDMDAEFDRVGKVLNSLYTEICTIKE